MFKKKYQTYSLLTVIFIFTTISALFADNNKYAQFFDHEKLIVSNYPEKISVPGLIFCENINNEPMRIMYYHQSIAAYDLQLKLEVTNKSKKLINLKVFKGIAGPNIDGIFAGHISTKMFFDNLFADNFEIISLKPGDRKILILHNISSNDVSTGIFKIQPDTSGQLQIELSVIDPEYPYLQDKSAKYTYAYSASANQCAQVDFNAKELHKALPVGDEPFIMDSKHNILLKGNYGQIYYFDVLLKNTEISDQRVCLYFSALGGPARGVIALNGNVRETGFFSIKTNNLKPQKLYEVILKPATEKRIQIATMPQAGSFYPINLILQSDYIQE